MWVGTSAEVCVFWCVGSISIHVHRRMMMLIDDDDNIWGGVRYDLAKLN